MMKDSLSYSVKRVIVKETAQGELTRNPCRDITCYALYLYAKSQTRP